MESHKDLQGIEIGGILSDTRQQEIQIVNEKLKAFNATKIALEYESKDEETLNQQYRSFLAGTFTLTGNERHQIGFKLAKDLEHAQLYAIDWMETGVSSKSIGDVLDYAKQKQPELYGYITERSRQISSHDETQPIGDVLRAMNSPTTIDAATELYISMARIGVEEKYLGLGWLLWWYQRNLIIFANLTTMVTEPSERILLLIGASHSGILNGFLSDSGMFDIIPATDYL